jgi:streptogramin lyase
MNAQLNNMARPWRTGLRYAGPMSVRPGGRLKVDDYLRVRGAFWRGRRGFGARAWAWLVVVAVAMLLFGTPAAVADPFGQISEFSGGLNPGKTPVGIAPGPDGNLWFTDFFAGAIGQITPSGQITEYSNGLTPGRHPAGIAAGPDGNLWFTDPGVVAGATSAVGRIAPSGQITEYSTGLNPGSEPFDIAPGADGTLWFTDEGATPAIGRITPSGQITEYPSGLNPGSEPLAIALGVDGNLWFTDEGAAPAIGRITPSGQITEYTNGLNPGSRPSGMAAGPDGNLWFTDDGSTNAIGRITPSGEITEYANGLNPGSTPVQIAAGPDGNLWFTADASTDSGTSAIGQITTSGQITEYSNGLNPHSLPTWIAPGADGNMWFTDLTGAIGRIGTGAPGALQTPASVTGAGQQARPEACQAQWADWGGYTARTGLYPFDGYTWLRDGNPIPSQTTPTYTPTAADVGHQLACRATVTYPLPLELTATTTSAAITIQPAPPPPSTPALSTLNVSPRTFTLRGRRVGGHCEPPTRSNQTHRPCTRRVAFNIRFTLSASATVTLTIQRAFPGRVIHGRCQAPTRNNHRHRGCTRLATLPSTIVLTGVTGANAFAFTAATSGHPLGPGSYRLLATPTTDGHTGNQRQTTFQITP